MINLREVNMRISLVRFATVLLLAALAGACANEKTEPEQEIAQLRMDIEQLTNALGRLEFRIYELENQQGTGDAVNDQAAGITNAEPPPIETATAPGESALRFDLAPAE